MKNSFSWIAVKICCYCWQESLTSAGSIGRMTARSSDRARKHMDRNRLQPARYEPAPAPQTAKCPCGRPRPRPQCGHPQPARATAARAGL